MGEGTELSHTGVLWLGLDSLRSLTILYDGKGKQHWNNSMDRRNTYNKKLQTDVSRGVHLHECSRLSFYHANVPRMKRG